MLECFATTIKGLEQILVNELTEFGAYNFTLATAGVLFNADFNTVMNLNLNSRIASRILIKVKSGSYDNEDDIYNLAYTVKWQEWFSVDKSIKVSTSAIICDLKSLNFITLRVKDAVCDYFVSIQNKRPDVNKDDPDIRIYTFLNKNIASIYIDSSGDALFKRGYRVDRQEAPIKENLAAGLIKLTQWDTKIPLLDPMCGSGTILIEAALIANNIAPGLYRSFAFEKFNIFNNSSFVRLKKDAEQKITTNKVDIYGSDISSQALEQTRKNISNSNINLKIHLNQINITELNRINDVGIVLTNPPYGIRLSDFEQLHVLYPQISSCLKKQFFNWDCYFYSADLKISTLMRLLPNKKIHIPNGSLKACLYKFHIVDGSNRKINKNITVVNAKV